MSNNLDITINDFENICRTCLSREDLKPLYEKSFPSTCLAEKLMSCTFVKFVEDDGLPLQICTNCIQEINQVLSFAKHCEKTDTILRNCVKNFKNEFANNSSQSEEAEEDMNIDVKPEIVLPCPQTVQEGLGGYEFVAVKQEEEEKIGYECHNTYDDLADENYEQDDNKKDQDETYFEKSKCKVSLDFQTKNVCSVCNKVFAHLHQLKCHARIHSWAKRYTCTVCNKAFTHLSTLEVHMRIHTGEKPYTCGVCSKGFTRSCHLKDHMRIHTGEKPYSCEDCGKSFTKSGNLSSHKRTHNNKHKRIQGERNLML